MAHAIINELNALKKQFSEKAQAALKSEFRSFFEKHPEVTAVTWTQYTPYFNDGSECEFSVNDPVFCEGDARPDCGDEDGDILYRIHKETEGYDDYSHRPSKPVPASRGKNAADRKLQKDCKELSSLIMGLEDQMKDMFGDHVKVIATRNGFDIEEYEHE
jgi:hypothetical protein